MFSDRTKTSHTQTSHTRAWTAGAAALAVIAVLLLLASRQPNRIYAVSAPVKPGVSVDSAWTSDLAPIVPMEPMSHQVYWAPPTGEN